MKRVALGLGLVVVAVAGWGWWRIGRLDVFKTHKEQPAEEITNDYIVDTTAPVNSGITVNAIGGDIHLSERDAKLSEAGDMRVYGYHVIGGAITGIPVVGDNEDDVVGVASDARGNVDLAALRALADDRNVPWDNGSGASTWSSITKASP